MSELDPEAITLGVLAERVKNVDATLNRFEKETFADFKKRLFGNGTPGELAKHEARISSLEKMVWMVNGMGVLLGFLVEFFSHFVFHK